MAKERDKIRRSLEQIMDKEFKIGMIHYCGDCDASKKIIYAHIKHQYLYVTYECSHIRTYIQKP